MRFLNVSFRYKHVFLNIIQKEFEDVASRLKDVFKQVNIISYYLSLIAFISVEPHLTLEQQNEYQY